jgi:hypothetical protein
MAQEFKSRRLGQCQKPIGTSGASTLSAFILDLDHRLLERIVQDLAIAGIGKQQSSCLFPVTRLLLTATKHCASLAVFFGGRKNLVSLLIQHARLFGQAGIVETPTFQRIAAENCIERVPVLEVLKRQPKEIVLTALVRMAEQARAYVYFAFVFTYGMNVLHASRNFLPVAVVAAAVDLMLIPVFGSLSDRIGRRRMYFTGALATAAYAALFRC